MSPPPPAGEAAGPAAAPEPQPTPADEAAEVRTPPVDQPAGEPGIEPVAVRDALRVAQLDDEVLVVDGHPRYHLARCPTLIGTGTESGTESIESGTESGTGTLPLAVSAARRAGFTPCAVCAPDSTLLARARERAQEKARQKAQDGTTERPTDEGQQL